MLDFVAFRRIGEDGSKRATFFVRGFVAETIELKSRAEIASVRPVEVSGDHDKWLDTNAAAFCGHCHCVCDLVNGRSLACGVASELGYVSADGQHGGISTRELAYFELGDFDVDCEWLVVSTFRVGKPAWRLRKRWWYWQAGAGRFLPPG